MVTLNSTVAKKSAWKSAVTMFAMGLGVAVLSGVADFISNTDLIATYFTDPQLQMFLIPLFAWIGQFLKDYVKHA